LEDVSKAQVNKYKLLGYLSLLPQGSQKDDVEGEEVGTICLGLSTGVPSVRCQLLPEEAQGYNNPASDCYNLK